MQRLGIPAPQFSKARLESKSTKDLRRAGGGALCEGRPPDVGALLGHESVHVPPFRRPPCSPRIAGKSAPRRRNARRGSRAGPWRRAILPRASQQDAATSWRSSVAAAGRTTAPSRMEQSRRSRRRAAAARSLRKRAAPLEIAAFTARERQRRRFLRSDSAGFRCFARSSRWLRSRQPCANAHSLAISGSLAP